MFNQGCRWFAAAGFPIRTSPDQRLYTAPRGFSQCPTSFFGVWRQGIHRKPLVSSSHVMRRNRNFSFRLLNQSHIGSSCAYSVGKVLTTILVVFNCCQLTGTLHQSDPRHPSSVNNHFLFIDNSARLIAGPQAQNDVAKNHLSNYTNH